MTKSFIPKLIGDIKCSCSKKIGENASFGVFADMKLIYEDWQNDNDCPDEYMFYQDSVNFEPFEEDILDDGGNFIQPLEFTITGHADDECNYMRHYNITITCSFDNDGIKITNTTFTPTINE